MRTVLFLLSSENKLSNTLLQEGTGLGQGRPSRQQNHQLRGLEFFLDSVRDTEQEGERHGPLPSTGMESRGINSSCRSDHRIRWNRVWNESTPGTREATVCLSVCLSRAPPGACSSFQGLTGKSVFSGQGCLICRWQGRGVCVWINSRRQLLSEAVCCEARNLLQIRHGQHCFNIEE